MMLRVRILVPCTGYYISKWREHLLGIGLIGLQPSLLPAACFTAFKILKVGENLFQPCCDRLAHLLEPGIKGKGKWGD